MMDIEMMLKRWGGFMLSGIAGGLVVAVVMGQGFGSETAVRRVNVQEESATIRAVEKALPSVVAIVSSENVRGFFGGVYEQKGGGTGFVISANGLIATNRHVVDSDNATYAVVTNDGKKYDASIVARDALADLAVLRVEAADLKPLELGDSSKLALGQRVIAVGNALGEYQNTVTTGVVSGIGRVIMAGDGYGTSEKLEGVIQTDAAINPGNSGGPLLNLDGQVIGINTAVDQQGQAVGFAIPINSVARSLESAIRSGEIVRPKLGVRYIPITEEFAQLNDIDVIKGALVVRGDSASEAAVLPGGPADAAGIREGDILISLDGKEISESVGLSTLLQDYRPNDTVEVKLLRSGQEMSVKVKLGKL